MQYQIKARLPGKKPENVTEFSERTDSERQQWRFYFKQQGNVVQIFSATSLLNVDELRKNLRQRPPEWSDLRTQIPKELRERIDAVLKSFYREVTLKRLTIPWSEPKTIHELEAHTILVHLNPGLMQEYGLPVYDLLEINTVLGLNRSLDAVELVIREILKNTVEPSGPLYQYFNDLVMTLGIIHNMNHIPFGDQPELRLPSNCHRYQLRAYLTEFELIEIERILSNWKLLGLPNIQPEREIYV
ncbi:MAG: hypothetical protein AABX38_05400 [Candidatus Micrarchaeota archaeon]